MIKVQKKHGLTYICSSFFSMSAILKLGALHSKNSGVQKRLKASSSRGKSSKFDRSANDLDVKRIKRNNFIETKGFKAYENMIKSLPNTEKLIRICKTLGINQADYSCTMTLFVDLVLKRNKNEPTETLLDKLRDSQYEKYLSFVSEQGTNDGFERFLLSSYFKMFDYLCEELKLENNKKLLNRSKILLDLNNVENSYPLARRMKRKIVMHVGPTNSGKTHHALKHLEDLASEQNKYKNMSGIYCGPLRLLAHEVYNKFQRNNINCDLITGEEKRLNEKGHVFVASSTVEMVDIIKCYDVAVIDEIQLMSDPQRGWAWTRALLGLRASRIFLCGEESSIELVKRICKRLNEEVEIKQFERLKPLTFSKKSLMRGLHELQSGDCIVAFSRSKIFEIKKMIDKSQGTKPKDQRLKCGVVYGRLPAENRAEQARKYNDANDKTKILVASDAIGMGLNLNIRRVIFTTVTKFNGIVESFVPRPLIKQIAGRAGRYSAQYDSGQIMAYSQKALEYIGEALKAPILYLEKAGVQPDLNAVLQFAYQFEGEKFSETLTKLVALSALNENYFVCFTENLFKISEAMDDIKMSLADKLLLLYAPWPSSASWGFKVVLEMARMHSRGDSISLKPFFNWDIIDSEKQEANDLTYLEDCHKLVMLYLWFSNRLSFTFSNTEETLHFKEKIEAAIDRILE